MPIPYSVVELYNPHKPDEQRRFYGRAQSKETVNLNKLVEQLSYSSTLTDIELYAVVRALIHIVKVNLKEGKCVELDDFGKFRYTISTEGAISKTAFDETFIKKVKLQFKPVQEMKPHVVNVKFERVLPKSVQKEAEKNYRET